MLTYEIKVACVRPNINVKMMVYANSKADAFKIAEAYCLTRGHGAAYVHPDYKFHGAAPAGAKVGVKPRQPTDFNRPEQKKAEDYLKGLDFGELEQRVLAYCEGKLGNLYADMASTVGVSAQSMKKAMWAHCYTPTGRVVLAAGGDANVLRPENENRRFVPMAEPCQRATDDKAAEPHYERAKFKDGRGYINLYPRSDGFVQAGNVYTTRLGAQTAAKSPESAATTFITWDTAPKVRRADAGWPLNFNNLQPGQIVHMQNRLRAWSGMCDQHATLKVYANTQVPGGYVNITIGSPRWQACLDELRAWLRQQGVAVGHRKGTTTVVEVAWADLAPRVWPL